MKNKLKKKKKKYILMIAIVLAFIISIITLIIIAMPKSANIKPTAEEKETSELNALEIFDEDTDASLLTINATSQDKSAVLVKNNATVTIRDTAITKYDGLISEQQKAETIGLNSAVVLSYGTHTKITGSKIETSVEYSNGIFINGKNSYVELIDTEIKTYGFSSPAMIVSTNASAKIIDSNISTKVKSSPAIKVTHEQGKVVVNKALLETNGSSSPIFENSGTLEINETPSTANGSRIAIIKNGKTTINGSTLVASGANAQDEEPSGFLIIGETNSSELIIKNSSININSKLPYYKTATMFSIDNTKTSIKLNNTQMNFGSSKLLNTKNSEVNLTLENQIGEGHITTDDKSKINIALSNNTIFMGSINSENENADITLKLDNNSKFVLTKDTYITKLENENKDNSNIKFSNYKLYINGKSIN